MIKYAIFCAGLAVVSAEPSQSGHIDVPKDVDKPRRLRGLQRHMKGNYTEPSSLRGRHLDSCGTWLFMKTCASDNDCCTSSGWTCGQDKKCGWVHFPGVSDKMNT